MKPFLVLALLLVAPVVLPASHRVRHRAGPCLRQVPHQHLQPLRIVRSPQPPKSVRPVPPCYPTHAMHTPAGPRHKA